MSFYQAMQLGACNLKPLIKESEDKYLKRKYIAALIVKDFLCLLFCMVIVTLFSKAFGEENSIVGVVTVLSLLTFRFSNLDFDVKQSAFTILGIFGICIISPYMATIANPILGSIINFVSIMAIVVLSCHNVVLANQSTFVLSYLLLYGYEVNSINGYINRVIGLIIGGIIVSLIFYLKQKNIKFENKILDIMKDVSLKNERTKWQLKITLGICSAILIGELMHLPRTMWIGFSCMSILQPSQDKFEFRYKKRPPFLVIGCLIFGILYLVLPKELRGYTGIIGGLMVGLSGTYQWQTVFNCFGALTAAVPVLGLVGAIIFRIFNNAFGAVYSKLFNKVFDIVDSKIFVGNTMDEAMEG